MHVRVATRSDVDAWAALRAALWPDSTVMEHRQEILAGLRRRAHSAAAFVAVAEDGMLIGFAEASLRKDYVNGCTTTPVAFLEGIYIHPDRQRLGVGRSLSAAVEAWAREMGCLELASDALLENRASHAFHERIGFEETERVVYFRKALQAAVDGGAQA